jgi:hypothetical protein
MALALQALDDLEQRLIAFDAQLPTQRSGDERDAAAAMLTCVQELRRLVDKLPIARQNYVEAQNSEAQVAAHIALRQLIHDLRTPASVLYTYLRLIVGGIIFPSTEAAQRTEAAALVELVLEIRDQAKLEGSEAG